MSIKAIVNIDHDGIKYGIGEIISDITKKDAECLIDDGFAVKIDDKFKKSNVNVKKVLSDKRKRAVKNEVEMTYGV